MEERAYVLASMCSRCALAAVELRDQPAVCRAHCQGKRAIRAHVMSALARAHARCRRPQQQLSDWKIERLFAWLHNSRRLVTRWERHVENGDRKHERGRTLTQRPLDETASR